MAKLVSGCQHWPALLPVITNRQSVNQAFLISHLCSSWVHLETDFHMSADLWRCCQHCLMHPKWLWPWGCSVLWFFSTKFPLKHLSQAQTLRHWCKSSSSCWNNSLCLALKCLYELDFAFCLAAQLNMYTAIYEKVALDCN